MILPGNEIDYHQYFFGIISKFIEVQMKPGQSMSGFYLQHLDRYQVAKRLRS